MHGTWRAVRVPVGCCATCPIHGLGVAYSVAAEFRLSVTTSVVRRSAPARRRSLAKVRGRPGSTRRRV